MNKIIAFFLILLFAFSVLGCSSTETASSSASSADETSGEVSSPSGSLSVSRAGSGSGFSSSGKTSGYAGTASGTGSKASDADTYALPVGSAVSEPSSDSSAQTDGRQKAQTDDSNSAPSFSKADLEPDNYSGLAVSEEEFDKIEDGMTYEQAEEIIGGSGKLQSEFGTKGSGLYTAVYRWKGYGSSDAYADLTFENGKLSMKIQFGLK